MTAKSEGLQWLLTMLNTFHSVFETLGGIHDKLPESIKKKIPEFFGQVDEKTLEEELLTRDIKNFLRTLSGQIDEKFNAFISNLKADIDRGEDRLTAFRVFLASGIKKGARQVKEFVPLPDGVKGKPTEVSYLKLDLDWAKGFIEEIVAFPTYAEQKKYVELDGGFATMKKLATPHPAVKKAMEFIKEKAKKIVLDTFGAASIEDLLKKARDMFSENSADLKSSTMSLREKAKLYRQKYEGGKKS